jgi:type II secretory pathway pseudopilin PulG
MKASPSTHMTKRLPPSRARRRPFRFATDRTAGSGRGFTITELLVVIGIIILLAGILLVALGRVRTKALETTTLATMQSFSQACDAFQSEHQQYPGVIPEAILARAIHSREVNVSGGANENPGSFTSTENALLHLMGGYRVVSPSDIAGQTPAWTDYNNFELGSQDYEILIGPNEDQWRIKVRLRDIGEGPVIERQQFGPYFTPGTRSVGTATGQMRLTGAMDAGGVTQVQLPDLLDAWGQPILYFRQVRQSGPLAGPPDDRPQFHLEGARAYLMSGSLGDRGENQRFNQSNNPRGSILSENLPEGDRYVNFAQLIRHPSFGVWTESPLTTANQRQVRARGAYALFSAGPDGIYFSAADGPGRINDPQTDLTDPDNSSPQVINEYNDMRIFGGG